MAKHKVFIGRPGGGYRDPDGLRSVIRRGIDALGVEGLGPSVFAKANWVFAHRDVARNATTRIEVGRAALDVLLERFPDSSWRFGGNGGANASTRAVAVDAGWWGLDRMAAYRGRVELRPSDEAPLIRYELSHGPALSPADRHVPAWGVRPEARFWESIVTDAALADCDHVVLFPKLKTNVLSGGMTAALKLTGIGMLMDRHRMKGHHFHNDRRIADMQELTFPDLVITDAITVAWGGNQMTQRGHDLGVVVMATNAVAHDATCARIFGLDPAKVEHVAIAAARGYGPIDPGEIEVVGDATVEELAEITADWGQTGLIPVDRFPDRFREETGKEFPWEIRLGPPRDEAGSPGLLLDWLYMSFDLPKSRDAMAGWPPLSVFVGDVDASPAHPTLLLVGDRAYEAFRKRAAKLTTWFKCPEGLRKYLGAPRRVMRYTLPDGRKGTAWQIPGDPPSHKEMILAVTLATFGRARAGMFRPDILWSAYWDMFWTRRRAARANPGAMRTLRSRDIPRIAARLPAPPPVAAVEAAPCEDAATTDEPDPSPAPAS